MARKSLSPRSSTATNKSLLQPTWALFLMGCVLGHFHGRYSAQTSSTTSTSVSVTTPLSTMPENHPPQHSQPSHSLHNGWSSIDVFYGRRNHLVEQPNNSSTSSSSSFTTSNTNIKQHEWYSQAAQDELIAGLLKGQRNGYFVDLAANDATLLSNTYAMEKYYGWNGLCIEPNPVYWKNLSYRQCQTVAAVAGPHRLEELHFRFQAGDHGGIAADGMDNGKRWQRSSEKVYSVPLLEILERYQAPHLMEYLSLDVEGAETFIMKDFPFDEYKFKIITAERLKGEIRQILKANGYEFMRKLTRWGESLWVHQDFKEHMDWSALERLQFPRG